MQINVAGLGETKTFEVLASTTADELLTQVENVSFTPASMMKVMKNGAAITGTLNLLAEETVEIALTIDVGMRAKWRKKRMRRLRRKRRKMRQRAR